MTWTTFEAITTQVTYIFINQYVVILIYASPVGLVCKIHRPHLYRGVKPSLNECSDITQNPPMVGLQSGSFEECGVPLSFPLLPSPLFVVTPNKVLTIARI